MFILHTRGRDSGVSFALKCVLASPKKQNVLRWREGERRREREEGRQREGEKEGDRGRENVNWLT